MTHFYEPATTGAPDLSRASRTPTSTPTSARRSWLHWLAREFGDAHYLPLSSRDLESLATAGTVETFGTGARLYRQGDIAESCFLIRSGAVRLTTEGARPPIAIQDLADGQVIGDHEMFRHMAHAFSAVALSPVEAIRFSRDHVMDVLAMHPRIGLRWLLNALEQKEAAHRRIAILLSGPVKSRLAGYLLSEGSDTVEITHDALAEVIGAERASVTRAIGALRDDNAIVNRRGSITVLDRDRLEQITGGAVRAPRDA